MMIQKLGIVLIVCSVALISFSVMMLFASLGALKGSFFGDPLYQSFPHFILGMAFVLGGAYFLYMGIDSVNKKI